MCWEYFELPCLYCVFSFIAWLTVGELCRIGALGHPLCTQFELLFSHLGILGYARREARSLLVGPDGMHDMTGRRSVPSAGEMRGGGLGLSLGRPSACHGYFDFLLSCKFAREVCLGLAHIFTF